MKEEALEDWERRDDESEKAFAYFVIYRDLGEDRSHRLVAEKTGKSMKTVHQHSVRHDWVERCRAWDRYQDKIARKAQLDEIKRMNKRHANAAMNMMGKALNRMKDLPEDQLSPQDIARWMELACKVERISRGEPETIEEHKQTGTSAISIRYAWPDNGRSPGD